MGSYQLFIDLSHPAPCERNAQERSSRPTESHPSSLYCSSPQTRIDASAEVLPEPWARGLLIPAIGIFAGDAGPRGQPQTVFKPIPSLQPIKELLFLGAIFFFRDQSLVP